MTQRDDSRVARFERVVASLLASELHAVRRGGFERGERVRWGSDTPVSGGEIGVDSLELIGVATAISDFFGLHAIGIEDRLLVDRTIGGWAALVADATENGCETLAFRTSGTSGEPKRIEHRLGSLRAEARFFAERFAGVERVVALVPAHHLYGFVHTVLVPEALGVGVADREFALRTGVVRGLRGGDLVVATPFVWEELRTLGIGIPPGVRGVSSGAPIDEETWRGVLALGLDGLTDVYGSTEAGAIGCRTEPGGRFTPVDEEKARASDQDTLEWDADGAFVVAGRADDCVQVGGVNVSRSLVAGTIRAHPDVSRCVTGLEGEGADARLCAHVVPVGGVDRAALVESLRAYARESLPAPERPAVYVVVDALETGAMGKPVLPARRAG
ncbi:MAG: AMP-binding protein [Planctomycetota bacterium]